MTVILDTNGTPITVGARTEDGGTVVNITEPDGDVNCYGRPVAHGPFVVVKYDDWPDLCYWTAHWNATGPWDDHRDDYTCDDVEVAKP